MPTLKGGKIEAVYIPEKKRGTLCVSSQVGCSMKCSFCATGAMSKANLRNLSAGEIVGQVLQARRLLAATAETRVMLQDDFAADDVLVGLFVVVKSSLLNFVTNLSS